MSARLPALLRGRRRALLAALAACGLAQAVCSVLTAVLTPRLLASGAGDQRWQLAGVLVGVAALLGVVRVLERVLGERLGQDYVHEIRLHLVRHALVAPRGPSVGVTVARATNDLTSVRNWVVQGIVPLVVGVPVLCGALVALALLSPGLAVAAAVPVALLGAVLVALAPVLRRRTALLRKQRGRLAGLLTDTVQAADGVVAAGGVEREVRSVRDQSRLLGELAVSRSVVGGVLRGSAATTATVAMVMVGAVGAVAGVDAGRIATAFLVVGMLSTPVTDLGRVGEYRQSFRVAERVLGPLVDQSRRARELSREHEGDAGRRAPVPGLTSGRVHLAGLELGGRAVSELVAEPGQVVVPRSADPQRVRQLVDVLTRPELQRRAWLQVAGHELGALPANQRRSLVGQASANLPIERGSIARAVRYRLPETELPAGPWLDEVGLGEAVRALPKGERTVLKRGGEPLDGPQRARLQLARAWIGEPPLMVLEHVDRALDEDGRRLLAQGLRRRRGVTLLVSDRPEVIAPGHRVWDLDADPDRPEVGQRTFLTEVG